MPLPSAPDAPGADALTRFRRGLDLPDGARLGLAVSGGPDSLGLLLLAHAALTGRIAVATVDHGLRPEATAEAAAVAELCDRLDIPHSILRPDHPLASGGNLQQQARLLRYGLLADWARGQGLAHIATAHQRDDVAEAFLMRALRGTGVGGLARMAPSAPVPGASDLVLLRPLLDWTRGELGELVAAAGLRPVVDPSNDDPRFDRARIRALLAREPQLDPARLARSAANLAEAETALDWVARTAWHSRAQIDAEGRIHLDISGLPREIRRRLAELALSRIDPAWDGEGLDGLVDALDTGQAATLAGVHAFAASAWIFRHAPPRRGTD